MKKYLLLTTVALLVSGNVLAEETELPTSGGCGTGCAWFYDESTKTIKISGNETGTGVMENYTYTYSGRYIISAPWAGYRDTAENVMIEGVSNIGNAAFLGFKIKNVEMDDNVTRLGTDSFAETFSLEKIKLSGRLEQVQSSAFQNIGQNVEIGIQNFVLPESLTYLADLKAINVDTLVMPSEFSVNYIRKELFSNGVESYRERVSVKTMYCTGEQMAACSAALQDARIDIEPTRYEKTSDGVLVYDKKGNAVSKYKDINALGAKEVAETYKYDSAGRLVGIFDGNGQRTWGKKIYTVEEAMEATKDGDKFHVYLTYK